MFHTFAHSRRQMNKLPLSINFAGYYHKQEPIVRNTNFQLFQWIYCVDGQGEFVLHGRKTILSPGEMVLIYPNEPHSYHAVTDVWHVHIIGFSGKCCSELLRTFRMHESGIYHFKNPEIFNQYFQKIIDIREKMKARFETKNKKEQRERRKNSEPLVELSKICYDFLLDLSLSATYVHSSVVASGNETIKTMIAYMEGHYSEVITLDLLAELVHLSKSYISDIFKQEMKQTIMQYLTNLRISQARALLVEHPEIRAGEIGRMCGFENPSYFGETFKKCTGMTPIEFRLS